MPVTTFVPHKTPNGDLYAKPRGTWLQWVRGRSPPVVGEYFWKYKENQLKISYIKKIEEKNDRFR